MARSFLDTSSWDRRVMRLSLCVLLVMAAGCATTPEPQPPVSIEDRTADSDYRLEAVADKLRQAERIEHTGGRAAAVLVVGTAQRMLPKEGYEREHDYLELVKAGMWAREGEGYDADKARALLDGVEPRATLNDDYRMCADIELVRVLLALAEENIEAAQAAGNEALLKLRAADAHSKCAEIAEDLAWQFLERDIQAAQHFAEQGLDTASLLQNDELVLRARLVLAQIDLRAGGNPEPHLLEAYEAAYRINDLGWRNVVISQAVNAWYQRDEYERVRRWGDRLRDHRSGSLGGFPLLEESGLWEGDYITLLAQYATAARKLAPESERARQAAELAVQTIEELPEDERKQWQVLAEKLRSGLLQEPAEK